MAIAVKDLIDAGVHFGHRASRWNPKMKPYIYGKRNLIHIIDLKETVRGLLRAIKYFNRVASGNGLILFVGTKRQAAETIIEQCQRSGMPYVTERWLGGTLTNFRTIRSRLERLEELEGILDGEQALTFSKKMISTMTRERRKISRNLEGIRHMTRLPEALFVVDPHREKIAVTEARKLGIKVVALLDTDCDPDIVDLPIPGNDDSMRSIELVIQRLTDAIIEGKASAPAEPPPGSRPEEAQARGDESRERHRGGPVRGPGIGASRGMAQRTPGGDPVLAGTTAEPGAVVEHGPEGGDSNSEIPQSEPKAAEPNPEPRLQDQAPPVPEGTPRSPRPPSIRPIPAPRARPTSRPRPPPRRAPRSRTRTARPIRASPSPDRSAPAGAMGRWTAIRVASRQVRDQAGRPFRSGSPALVDSSDLSAIDPMCRLDTGELDRDHRRPSGATRSEVDPNRMESVQIARSCTDGRDHG